MNKEALHNLQQLRRLNSKTALTILLLLAGSISSCQTENQTAHVIDTLDFDLTLNEPARLDIPLTLEALLTKEDLPEHTSHLILHQPDREPIALKLDVFKTMQNIKDGHTLIENTFGIQIDNITVIEATNHLNTANPFLLINQERNDQLKPVFTAKRIRKTNSGPVFENIGTSPPIRAEILNR